MNALKFRSFFFFFISHTQHTRIRLAWTTLHSYQFINLEFFFFVVHFTFQPAVKSTTAGNQPAKIKTDASKNVMRDLHIRKLCLNICVGESGDRLTRAAKVGYSNILAQLCALVSKTSFHLFICVCRYWNN